MGQSARSALVFLAGETAFTFTHRAGKFFVRPTRTAARSRSLAHRLRRTCVRLERLAAAAPRPQTLASLCACARL